MQFRLLASSSSAAATNLNRIFFSSPPNITTTVRSLPPTLINFTTSSTGCTADPALYSDSQHEEAAASSTTEKETEQKPTKENDPFMPPKAPPVSSAKLKSTGVNEPVQPITQQKRHNSSTTANVSPIEGVSCAGLDGSPWPEEENDKSDGDWSRERKEQEEDDMEYYSHHKASPLSEIEVADSRKPLAKVMHGTADGYKVGGSDELILFREEQLDTAEEALRRATEMWRESAVRGDPDTPHGRILRALRGEYW